MTKRQTLYVQTQGAEIVYSRNLEEPTTVKMPLFKFLPSFCESPDRIMLRGGAENAALIAHLHQCRRDVAPVYLCTPKIQGPDPAATFAAMRECNLPGSLGGFHELTERDAPSYALAAAMHVAAGHVSTVGMDQLREHRAWSALSFVSGLDPISASRFLCDVLDPRWFVSLKNPNSLSRLHCYLGLTPRNIEHALAFRPPVCRQARRCATVLAAWYRGPHATYEADDPGAFLQRVVEAEQPAHKIKGFVRASRMFVSFVRDVWLELMDLRGTRLFVPKYFFRTSLETVAFYRHMQEYAAWRKA